jgi:hypothetical protein
MTDAQLLARAYHAIMSGFVRRWWAYDPAAAQGTLPLDQ